jgi:phasin family protein
VATVPADKVVKTEDKIVAAAKPVTAVETKPVAPLATAPVVLEAKPAPVVAQAPKVEPIRAEATKVQAPKIQAKTVAPAAVKAKKAVAKKVAPKPVKTRPVTVRKVKPKTVAAPAAQKGMFKMTDTVKQVEETFKKATAEASTKATEMFKDVTARAKTAMEKMTASTKDMVEFNKANMEAVVEAGKIAAKGTQTVAQNAAEYSRKNFEATTAMLKTAAAVKSPTELFKVQGDFARSQFDGAVAEMSKSTEFSIKLMGEIFQPIQNRYSVAAEALKTRMAA